MNVVEHSQFELTFPRDAGAPNEVLTLAIGDTLFVLGANGTGKSALLQRFSSTAHGRARRISAHRQTWLQSDALVFSSSQKQTADTQLTSWDTSPQSRWMEQQPGQRSNVTLYDLIDAENVDARAIAGAVREGRVEAAQELAKKSAPIATVNDLLLRSNLPIEISVEGGDRLMASKAGGPKYGAAELSDGERNALLIGAEVLTAKPGTLLIIDEPERHLHRSIISPLLTHLFKMRDDCAFIVATHDLTLPMDNPEARTLLVRSCSFSGQTPVCWEADVLAPNTDIDETTKQDLLGARRAMVFVEGDESSLDKPLYSLLFPSYPFPPRALRATLSTP